VKPVQNGVCGAAPLAGVVKTDASGARWTYLPRAPLPRGQGYCVSVASGVYDLEGESLSPPFTRTVSPASEP
jgi:hypothetical protein